MKEGAWLEASTGSWHWIDDHADWIRRPVNARSVGLPEEAVTRIAAMPRQHRSGPERTAIILEAMRHGLIRFRGHGTEVTFESTLPLEVVIPAVSRFMAEQFGPMTWSASTGSRMAPALASPNQDLERALEAGELSCLVASKRPPASETPALKGT